jgi:hypothetical protein
MPIVFFKKDKPRHKFNDEDRELSAERRRASAELRRQKQEIELLKLQRMQRIEELRLKREEYKLQQELKEMEEDDDDYDDQPPENALLMGLLGQLAKNNSMDHQDQVYYGSMQQQEPTPTQIDVDDKTIDETLSQIPKKYLKMAKKMNDTTLSELIKSRMPALSEASVSRTIKRFRETFK